MKSLYIMLCVIASLFAGCGRNSNVAVPSEVSLLVAATANGNGATIEKYDPKVKIATVRTPGWLPEEKPYQFDGEKWIPLWSPYEMPKIEEK